MIKYLKEFAESRGLEHCSDRAGNLVIRRPSSFNPENPVIVQGHIDMVTEKHASSKHDFFRDPIVLRRVRAAARSSGADGKLHVVAGGGGAAAEAKEEEKEEEEEWLTATDTTLGADNGVGVAAALALLEAPADTKMPPLECLFTVDEETGLTGAMDLDVKALGLTGRTLLNLDTEEWGSLYFGCAGGGKSTLTLPVAIEPLEGADAAAAAAVPGVVGGSKGGSSGSPGGFVLELAVSGLMGGHSGINIGEGRGNALKLLLRALHALQREATETAGATVRVVAIQGGEKHNAIPREATARLLVVPAAPGVRASGEEEGEEERLVAALTQRLGEVAREVQAEYANETGLRLGLTAGRERGGGAAAPGAVAPLSVDSEARLLQLLTALPDGVVKYSHACPDLVETSTNVASVRTERALGHPGKGGRQGGPAAKVTVLCSSRSSLAPALEATRRAIAACAGLCSGGGTACAVEEDAPYPGWAPNPNSAVLGTARRVLGGLLPGGEGEVEVVAIHAGLECGLLGEKLDAANGGTLDMVSFGPTITGAHSPDERLLISTVPPFWALVQGVLEELALE